MRQSPQWESGADFSPGVRVDFESMPTVWIDVDDSPHRSLVGALEQDLMSSPGGELGFIGLWPEQENAESDGESVVSGDVPDVFQR